MRTALRNFLLLLIAGATLAHAKGLPTAPHYLIESWQTDQGLPQNSVTSMSQARDGYLWLATFNGLVRFDGVRFTVFNAHNTPQLNSSRIVRVWHDGGGALWINTEPGGIIQYSNGVFKTMSEAPSSPKNDVLIESAGGISWRIQRDRVGRYADDKLVTDIGGPETFGSPPAILFEDSQTNLWIGTIGAGAIRIGADGEKEFISDQYGLGHAQVRSIFEDREGNIWLGTDGAGLHRLRRSSFTIIDKSTDLGAETAFGVVEDDEGLWIGSNGGGATHVSKDESKTYFATLPVEFAYVWTLLNDEKEIWAGTWSSGVLRKGAGNFEPVPELGILGSVVVASHKAADGTLWFGGPGGLASWRNGTVQHYTKHDGLSHEDVRAIIDDGEGGLWIATNGGGVNHFRDGKFASIQSKNGLVDNVVWTLFLDAEKTLWAGTFGGGLSSIRKGKIKNYTTDDGLPSNVICSIAEDRGGDLWFSSYNGVFRIRKSDFNNYVRGRGTRIDCLHFSKPDGLPSRECTGSFSPASCVMRDGRMAFPTVRGVAILDPNQLRSNHLPPTVSVEDVDIDGVNYPIGEISDSFVIPPRTEHLEFRYTGLSFSAPEKMRFRYKLEGFDTEWQEAGNRRTAYYSRVPPADYVFKVMASNNDGVWSRTASILEIRVQPTFWQTWWFKAGCVLTAGGALTGVVRLIEKRKLRRRMEVIEQQHALERERARIAKDIHDDLGASLTQITLLSELARTDLAHPEQAEAHIRQISGTARELTRAMDEIVWAINPQNDTLEDLLTYTVKFAQEHLKLANIRCRLDAPPHLPPLHLSAEIRHNLFLAVKEAINNVAKHSHATEAWLRLRAAEKHFTFEVEDNGVGFPSAALDGRLEQLPSPGSHNGLRNIKRRIHDIGGAFELLRSQTGGALIRMRVAARPPELVDN